MIKVELLTEKPIALQVQEAVHMAVSMSPLAGTIKGRDAFSPFIGDHGTWMCWDDLSGQWVDTGVKAAGVGTTPGTSFALTAETICAALGYMPVGSHTHSYDELTNKPLLPAAAVQDVQVNGKSIITDGIAHISQEMIMSLIEDGSEVEY